MTALRAIAAALLCFACGAGQAQTWPVRPVRLVIAFPPGGPADIVGRAVAQRLGDALGQPFVIDNRPGGSANIGAEAAARSLADGYTLFLATSTHATNASLFRTLRYDKAFMPYSLMVDSNRKVVRFVAIGILNADVARKVWKSTNINSTKPA